MDGHRGVRPRSPPGLDPPGRSCDARHFRGGRPAGSVLLRCLPSGDSRPAPPRPLGGSMMSLREYREPTSRLPDYLPWAALISPGVVLQKDAILQKTIAFRGPDLA